ncbi:DUF6515 family protein [Dyadobacter jiangsuensis]|uniref:Uncharacterized protein n=1 Tax=Dyadobacter jiangsuensis TaxID=1591085 RepID=A0A2P8FAP0_9BACT|nr:DUF6515 family protein [Dyadobacter jiangsuensis]PSL18790.1 hypothetical protein CLV60_12919 [Dyadobacter jiangsuensis]
MKTLNRLLVMTMMALSLHANAQSSVTVIRRPPRESKIVVHAGVRYHYYGGVYYKPYGRQYVVVRPPVGLRVTVLPVGYASVTIGRMPYFYAGGVYYVQYSPGRYEVVEPPKELAVNSNPSQLSALPEGAQSVYIAGRKYYKINDTYYEKSVSENGGESYVVVGKVE